MDWRDAYKTLGLSEAKVAQPAEIEAAWKRQAMKSHPDRDPSAEAAARFRAAGEAKEAALQLAADAKAYKQAALDELLRQFNAAIDDVAAMPSPGGQAPAQARRPRRKRRAASVAMGGLAIGAAALVTWLALRKSQ